MLDSLVKVNDLSLVCLPARHEQLQCVHELFEAQAFKTPREIALLHNDRGMTYAELNDRADMLAHHLRSRGVGPDVAVLIGMQRGFDMICAVLAVLKAGGACAPIDPGYPSARIRSMISQSGADLLLTTEATVLPAVGDGVSVIMIDRAWDDLVDTFEVNPYESATIDNLAYILFTSGSTGAPKGVAMPHSVLANLARWQAAQSAMPVGARTVQFASLSFNVSFQEIFSTLCGGGTLVLVDEEVRRDPAKLLKLTSNQQIERLFMPYVALKQLAEAAQHAAIVPASLTEVITAGEQLQIGPALVSFFKKVPHCKLRNQYGPTETHVVTQYTLSGQPAEWPALPPIGKAIPGAQIRVLNSDLRPVRPGETGELYIGGVCVARGYLGSPELTAERFMRVQPGDAAETELLYRTGDLVRQTADGNLEFMGRADDQIKIRGYRIDPAEIEQVLASHPSVTQAGVVLRGDKPEEQRLVAFVVPKSGAIPEVASIIRFVESKLPAYMTPAEFVPMEQLPTTSTGKLDRQALARDDRAGIVRRARYSPPRRALEQAIAALWTEILGVQKPGLYDNFFDLGGTSILAVQAHRRLQTIAGKEFSIAELFQRPTISALVRFFGTLDEDSYPAARAGDRAVVQRSVPVKQANLRRRTA